MKTVRNLSLVLLLLCSVSTAFSQMPGKVFQLSGLVINSRSQDPIPYARISVNKTRRGTFANMEGFYSLPVLPTDTVFFSSLGYQTSFLVVSDYLEQYKGDPNSPFVYAINYMDEDSIVLPALVIFPYNNANELRTALIETDVPDLMENINARSNLNPEVMDILIETMKVDEGERVMVARQMYYNQQQQQRVAPTMTLFDPIAVYRLLNYIHTKTKERRTKDLEYWPD